MLRVLLVGRRTFAAAPKAKGKPKKVKESKMGKTTSSGPTGFALGEKVPINIFKDGSDPIIKADSEYPNWLFTKANRLPTLKECLEKMEKDRSEGFLPNPDISQRYNRIKNLLIMRKRNAESKLL